jgi:muramoyltetrapeptide carboxypeptidase LdcA involved in peptidoglycan recycling
MGIAFFNRRPEPTPAPRLIRPPMLRPGDRVAAVSLSWGGPGAFPHRYEAGRRQLEAAFGVEVRPTRYALREPAWLSANPRARAEDLMEAFADPAINGIIATIGGDDSLRLLPYLDLPLIGANPKVFLGYSDTTVTHLACYAAGLTSFYGPTIMSGFGENGGLHAYLKQAVRRTIFMPEAPGVIEPNPDGWTVEQLDWGDLANQARRRALTPSPGWRWLQGEGPVEGRLIGGCLEVLDWLRGTPVWPGRAAWEGAVLFLETSEEAPSPLAVTRMLRSLAACGALERAGALLFGRPGGDVPPERFAEYDEALLGVVRDELGRGEMPIVTLMDFGHTDPIGVLPYGVLARVDPQAREVRLLEAGVSPG